MKILNAYDKSQGQVHPKCGKTMTEQHHKKACDINTIMARYQKTGLVDHVNRHSGSYGDATGADFKAAQDLVATHKSIFEELPAQIRAEYDNDVAIYLDDVATEEGVERLKGLLDYRDLDPLADQEDDEIVPETAPEVAVDGEAEVSSAVT